MVKVKICGVRTVAAAQAAIDGGADFIGLNFVPKSKRKISIEKAQKIADSVRNKIKIVGVFQNQKIDDVIRIAEKVGLDIIQLHGDEDTDYRRLIKQEIIKVVSEQDIRTGFPISPSINLGSSGMTNREYILIDRVKQGEGEMVEFEKAKKLAEKYKLFFAGGLTPENVSSIVAIIKPYAVDVASGVETNGQQDIEKIKKFIREAKSI